MSILLLILAALAINLPGVNGCGGCKPGKCRLCEPPNTVNKPIEAISTTAITILGSQFNLRDFTGAWTLKLHVQIIGNCYLKEI